MLIDMDKNELHFYNLHCKPNNAEFHENLLLGLGVQMWRYLTS